MARLSRRRAPFAFEYRARATDGGPDQVLVMHNHTQTAMVPTIEVAPHDFYGRELPNVVTRFVHGSDRGRTLLPAGGSAHDVLHFSGPGSRDVRQVGVRLVDAEETDGEGITDDVRSVMIDLDQRATLDPDEFWGIGLVNPNPVGVAVSVALLAFEERERDYPRQVVDVVTLEDDVDMASESNEVIWLPEDVRGQFHAVDHHLVPRSLV